MLPAIAAVITAEEMIEIIATIAGIVVGALVEEAVKEILTPSEEE